MKSLNEKIENLHGKLNIFKEISFERALPINIFW